MSDPRLHVHASQQLLDVDEIRLDLDHEGDRRERMPGEQVDSPTLAEMVEAHLGTDDPPPARQALLDGGRPERSVAGVREAVDRTLALMEELGAEVSFRLR